MSKGRRRGKELERYVAKLFNGRRLGLYGTVDVEAGNFAIECKERQTPLVTLKKWMDQATFHACGKIPVVYFHVNNESHNDDLVILFAPDFKELQK